MNSFGGIVNKLSLKFNSVAEQQRSNKWLASGNNAQLFGCLAVSLKTTEAPVDLE